MDHERVSTDTHPTVRRSRIDAWLPPLVLALAVGAPAVPRAGDLVASGWQAGHVAAAALQAAGQALAFGLPVLAPLALTAFLGAGLSRRARAAAFAGTFLAWLAAGWFLVPATIQVTNDVFDRQLYGIMGSGWKYPDPAPWTILDQLRALATGQSPAGGPLDAFGRLAIAVGLRQAAWTAALLAAALSPLLRRRGARFPWWLALALVAGPVLVHVRLVLWPVDVLATPARFALEAPVPLLTALLGHRAVTRADPDADAAPARVEPGRRAVASRLAAFGLVGLFGLGLARPESLAVLGGDGPAPGSAAAPITVVDVDGGTARLAEHEGEVVVLTYWASWCGPCRAELDFLGAMSERHGDAGLTVLAVNNGEGSEVARRYFEQHPQPFEPLLATDDLVRAYPPITLPTSYVIGRRGRIRHVHRGFPTDTPEALEAELVALLAESP